MSSVPFLYTKKGQVLSFIALLICIIVINLLVPSEVEHLCNMEESMKNRYINGTVKRTYIDRENHNYRIVVYHPSSKNLNIRRIYLTLATNNLFKTLKPGDHIQKEKGSLVVVINGDKRILIDFGVTIEQCREQ